MNSVNDLARFANLIGDPTRSAILLALMAGKALTAGELTIETGLTAQTVSSHLKKLEEGQMIVRRKQGRHHYFTLVGIEMADILEKMIGVAAGSGLLKVKTGPKSDEMCQARVCYDHLAGHLSVQLFDKILNDGVISLHDDQVALTPKGECFFSKFGLDVRALHKAKRPTCRSCLDWSERRFHLAGGLGAGILNKILVRGWAYRIEKSRTIKFTPNGMRMMSDAFELKFTM